MLACVLSAAFVSPLLGTTDAAEDLVVAVKATKPTFTTREVLSFTVSVTNNSKASVTFYAMGYLGSSTIGRYELLLQGAQGTKWEMVRDTRAVMPGAPAMARKVDLAPGKSFSARTILPGVGQLFRKAGDRASKGVRHLPPGKYALKMTVTVLKEAIEAAPASFAVVAAPPAANTGVSEEAATRAAKAFLAQRLKHYQDRNAGKEPWKSLTAESFKPTAKLSGQYWSFRFEAPLKNPDRNLGISIVVDGKGEVVSRNPGFAIHQKVQNVPPGLTVEPTRPL